MLFTILVSVRTSLRRRLSKKGSSDCYVVSGASAGIVNSDSASIIEAGNCTVDARSVDPGLLTLRNNGGRTKTHALSAGSQARDTGIPITCRTFDQRNQSRFGSGDPDCDVGAIEFNLDDDDSGFSVIPMANGKVVVILL